jgi:DNA-directed RNA polymerase specialized sigma24 family protein
MDACPGVEFPEPGPDRVNFEALLGAFCRLYTRRRMISTSGTVASEDGYEAVEERLSPRRALAEALDELPGHERRALELRRGRRRLSPEP